jgi:hypothetical protein
MIDSHKSEFNQEGYDNFKTLLVILQGYLHLKIVL